MELFYFYPMKKFLSAFIILSIQFSIQAQDLIPDIVFKGYNNSTVQLSAQDSIECHSLLKAYSKALITPNPKAFKSFFITQDQLQIVLANVSKSIWKTAFKTFRDLSNQLSQTLSLNKIDDKRHKYEYQAQLINKEGNWIQAAAAITFYVDNERHRISFHLARINNIWVIGKETIYINNKKVIEHNYKKFIKAKINYQSNLDSIKSHLNFNQAKALIKQMLEIDKQDEYLKELLINIDKEIHLKKQLDFLLKNAKRTDVKVTESGLQYEILTFKDGIKPSINQRVLTHYEGIFINGDKFDSSYDRKEPLEFGLTSVIKGWTEGLQLMSPGSKYKFYIPYQLAYGEKGVWKSIPPFSTLIFVVELIEIK